MSLVTEEMRAKATIYYGNESCQEKKQLLLKEVGLPEGLLPLEDVEECGYVEETGFVWLKQKKKTEHRFEKIGKLVSYATEVSAYAEPCKIKQLNGVKVKELLFWITLSEITVPVPNGHKVTFKSYAGPSRTFPAEAFFIEAQHQQGGKGKEDLLLKDKEEEDNDYSEAAQHDHHVKLQGVESNGKFGNGNGLLEEAKEVKQVKKVGIVELSNGNDQLLEVEGGKDHVKGVVIKEVQVDSSK
ncbi:hypothetical protein Dimus_012053 [Dionaea muscipula]